MKSVLLLLGANFALIQGSNPNQPKGSGRPKRFFHLLILTERN